MNKYNITLRGFISEVPDMPVNREYDTVEGLLEAMNVLKNITEFLDRQIFLFIFRQIKTDPTKLLIFELLDINYNTIGFAYIEQV